MTGLSFVNVSARGLVRKDNQDSLLCLGERAVFAVADGMGGGAEGERASRMVCETVAAGVTADTYEARLKQVEATVRAANAAVFGYAAEHGIRQMGSTVSLMLFDPDRLNRAAIAYVGDSRVYRFRAGVGSLLTRDHSIGSELADTIGGHSGSRFAVRSNPLAHVLTRAIGPSDDVSAEWRKVDVRPGDRYMICSDGVHDVLDTGELAGIVCADGLKRAAERLEAAVLERGAPDNYSFILIETGDAR